jgi:hypothetical protein
MMQLEAEVSRLRAEVDSLRAEGGFRETAEAVRKAKIAREEALAAKRAANKYR